MLKYIKTLLIYTLLSIFTVTSVNADIIRIDDLKGLQRNPKADRIEDGAHDRLDNMYINYGNIQNVKGRDRLNSTAHTDIVVNGLFYYENQAGTTKKLVVAETDELVTYDIDGTNRTQIASGLTNEKWDAQQFGDILYLTSSTNGLYKWTGAGSATVITGVSAPSSANFSATTGDGGLTSGFDALIQPILLTNSSEYSRGPNGSTCLQGFAYLRAFQDTDVCADVNCTDTGQGSSSLCFNSSDFTKTCATTVTYKYKVAQLNSITGIESEPSSNDDAILTGSNNINMSGKNPFLQYGSSPTCTVSPTHTEYQDAYMTVTGKQTRTLATLPTAVSPFDKIIVYRTVAGGSDYFLNGIGDSAGSFADGKPDVSLSTPLDTTIDTITPPSFRYIEEYKGVIFVAEDNTIKYSHLPTAIITDADKYWLDSDELQVSGNITGLKKASDSLLIFTTNSVYQLIGFGATSFRLIPIISGIGAVNDETIEVDTNGDVIFFTGTSGVYKLSIGQQQVDSLSGSIIDNKNAKLTKLSSPNLDNVFRGEDSQIALSVSDYPLSHAYYDSDNNYYFLYIGSHQFLFNAVNNTWSHIPATRMVASVYTKSPSLSGQSVIVDNLGFFFNNWKGFENGIESGTVTSTATSSTTNTLTCTGCTFNTTNDGLKGLWIYIENDNQEYHQISSNTGSEITISDTWASNPTTSDTFYIAYIIPKWRTKQYSFIKPPDESKVAILYINHNKSESEQILDVFAYQEKSSNGIYVASKSLDTKFIDVFNTRMRSSWAQWEFRSYIYNISNTIAPPIDIVSYAVDAEAEKSVNHNG